jgi:hypothetical protein
LVDAAEIVGNLVDLLRDIPDLVEAMNGDAAKIYAYEDRYPKNNSLERAKGLVPSPGIMIGFEGSGPARYGEQEVWEYRLSASFRAAVDAGDPTPSGYYRLFRLLVKGVPSSGDGTAMQYRTVHESCMPMGTPMMDRKIDINGNDYFEVSLSFIEMGDD